MTSNNDKLRDRFRHRSTSIAALIAATSAVAALSQPAMAQVALDDAEAETAVEDAEATLGKIIVTATKRATDLQDTPISISVVDAELLADRHVQALLDFADGSVPSLRATTFESRQTALTVGIRGIVPNDANQPARDQGVGVYLDGVYLGRQHGLNAAMLDIERVEILKGPQGTLFGRNTEGGALSLVSRKPSGDFGFRATAGIGNLGAYNGEVHLDLPEFADLSIKLDGAIQYRDPITENPLPGEAGWGYFDRRGLRAAFLWEPTDSITAQYTFDTGYDANTAFYSQLINYNPLGRPIATTFPIPSGTIAPLPPLVQVRTDRMDVADIGVPQNPSIDETFGHSLHVNWEINENLELRSITAYRDVGVEQWDNAGGAHRPAAFAPNGNFSRYSLANFDQFQRSQEFQLVGSTERIDYVLGLYYFNEKVWDDAATPSTNRWNATGTAYTINDPTPTLNGARSLDRASKAKAESTGAFVHVVYTPPILDDKLHLTLGGRQTNDKKSGTLFKVNNVATNLTFDIDSNRFDPVFTAAYDVTPDINLYGTYSTGYRAGGASSRSLTYRSFEAEEVKSYELGLKSTIFDRLRVNLAAYKMERTNSQIDFTLVTVNPITNSARNTVETVNAPGVTDISGLELDASLAVTENLSLSMGYAYTDTSVPLATNPFSGIAQQVYIIYTPENAASGSIDYSIPLSFATIKAHLNANYADGQQSFEQYAQLTDSSFIVNANLALADIEMKPGVMGTLSLWSRNLLNEEHIYRRSQENRTTLGDYANFNEPRTFGAQFSIAF